MLSKSQIAEIKARADQADDGPWEYVSIPECLVNHHVQQVKGEFKRYTIATPVHSNECTRRNMVFIAHARQDIPALFQHIEELEDRLKDAT